ncbi:MAG: DUF4270 family protein [Bacteroidota bacterium]
MKGLFKNVRRAGAITGLISLLILISCEEDPSFVGRELLPSADDLNSNYTEDISIETDVTGGEPVPTSVTSAFLLGSYYDQNFGLTKADFMTKFIVADTSIEQGILVDSMILSFAINDFFGDSLSVQTLKLYELTEGPEFDTLLYSNTLPDGKYNPFELAQKEISPNDSIIRIKIVSPSFFQKFEEVHDSVYADPFDFINFFQGFYVTSTNVNDRNAILYLDWGSEATALTMYYRESVVGETQSLNMIIDDFTPRVNTYYYDYTGSEISQYLDEDIPEDTVLFVAGMAIADTRISFPGLEEWRDKKPVAINKAELFIPAEDSIYTDLSPDEFPATLSLLTYNAEDELTYLYDYRMDGDSKSYFGGKYDRSANAYVFNIGAHFQSYIDGDVEHMDMVLKPARNSISASRVILKGPGAVNRKMKLKITYTEF